MTMQYNFKDVLHYHHVHEEMVKGDHYFDYNRNKIDSLEDCRKGEVIYVLNNNELRQWIFHEVTEDGFIGKQISCDYSVMVDAYRLNQDEKFELIGAMVDPEELIRSGELNEKDILMFTSIGTKNPIKPIPGSPFIDPKGLYFIGGSYNDLDDEMTNVISDDPEEDEDDEDEDDIFDLSYVPVFPIASYYEVYGDVINRAGKLYVSLDD